MEGVGFGTSQPFRPKLRLTRHMSVRIRHIRILALLLAVIFLGAQFHYCADLSAGPSSSHICPTCSTIGSVVVPLSPGTFIERHCRPPGIFAVVAVVFSMELPHATSPRAPPLL